MPLPIDARPIPSAPGYYVTSTGDVWSTHERRHQCIGPHRLTPRDKGHGYLHVNIRTPSRPRVEPSIHSLVAEVFLGPRPLGMTIDHRDGNKRHNAWTNLEYVTAAENCARFRRRAA